ncbi:Spy/CpxP family protein refolding chaperone [Candidatus Zixiibacteriota bacterium]
MKRTTGLLAGAALCMVMTQVGTSAQQGEMMQRQRVQQRPELTEEQKTEIQQIRERHQEAMIEAQAALVQARADLQKLMLEKEPDLRDLEQAMNALSRLENAQKIQSIRNRAEIMQVLPEDQQQRFNRAAGILAFRGAMSSRLTGFNRGRGIMPGYTGRGRGQGVRPGRSFMGRGRGSMQGGARSGQGGNTGMMNRGRMIPPVPQNEEQFNRQGMMRRGMAGVGGRSVVAPPPPPPPAG